MARLSSAIRDIKDHYAVVVIGSGYGGSIAASRLARAGQQVALLERGREIQSGEFPDAEPEVLAEMQAELPTGHVGSRAGLYEFHVNPDVNVFVGCGLGGTSLINANIALRPDPRVFQDQRWPKGLRDDLDSFVDEGFHRAHEMLRPTSYPSQYPPLPKLEALEQSARHLGETCQRAPIAVNFEEMVNHVGVQQSGCVLCGDCVTGCNHDAKNTLAYNYLPDARNFGAEIFTQIDVRRLERQGDRWLVHYQVLDTGLELPESPTRTLSASVVILAAGTLGTAGILLRSKAAGLPLSNEVGNRFSGNGDVLGYSYGCAEEIRGVGYGPRDPREMEAVGPCVTGLIDMRQQPNLDDGIVIQEFATPGALSGLLPLALAKTASALGKYSAEGLEQALSMDELEVESLFLGPYEADAQDTQAYLVTTHERGSGRIHLDGDRLRIEWPHVGTQPIFEKVNDTLAEATRPLGGSYLINPVWSKLFNRDLITVHPLGGCVMAEDSSTGVVNHKGQVFSATSGSSVYENLYVCDGSVIPRSLGVSPMLTISAISERAAALLARDRGWTIDYSLPSRPASRPVPGQMGARFADDMRGEGFELSLTIVSDDLEKMLADPAHRARVAGQLTAESLSAQPLAVTAGEFNLAEQSYRLNVQSQEGNHYECRGRKQGQELALTISDTANPGASPVQAVLRTHPHELRQNLTTISVTGAASLGRRREATERLGRALAGDLYEIYGGITGSRKKRPLRVNAPTVHFLESSSDPRPRLIRYEGGSRGPVILSGGPGIASLIFSLDTIDVNLVEFLFSRGYDIWLLDFADAKDHPAAIKKVQEATGAANVQLLTQGWETSEPVELNLGTQEALHEIFGRTVSLVGRDAAKDVFPRILGKLEAGSRAGQRSKVK